MNNETWTVSDAKAHLSEILRRSRTEGPQRIGTREPCVVVSEDDWKRLAGEEPKLGAWLLERLAGSGELELPSREDPSREVPFEAIP